MSKNYIVDDRSQRVRPAVRIVGSRYETGFTDERFSRAVVGVSDMTIARLWQQGRLADDFKPWTGNVLDWSEGFARSRKKSEFGLFSNGVSRGLRHMNPYRRGWADDDHKSPHQWERDDDVWGVSFTPNSTMRLRESDHMIANWHRAPFDNFDFDKCERQLIAWASGVRAWVTFDHYRTEDATHVYPQESLEHWLILERMKEERPE
jgi:hypothetical protein